MFNNCKIVSLQFVVLDDQSNVKGYRCELYGGSLEIILKVPLKMEFSRKMKGGIG